VPSLHRLEPEVLFSKVRKVLLHRLEFRFQVLGVGAVQPQRQLRLPQVRAGGGARLRASLPALHIRTGRVATSSEGKEQRIWRQVLFSAAVKERTTATILKDNVEDVLTRALRTLSYPIRRLPFPLRNSCV
jgi:hypothetical protein